MTDFIYHLVATSDFPLALPAFWAPQSLQTERFVHCSTVQQLTASADRHYANRDCVALCIDPAKLEVRYEASARDATEFYPHIYQAIPAEAIKQVIAVPLGANGTHVAVFDSEVVVGNDRNRNVAADFIQRRISLLGETRDVFVAGSGPAIVVMHEVPGLHPGVVEFSRRLVARGFAVYMPSLFGSAGKPSGPLYSVGQITRACISREFSTWALERNSPIVNWCSALASLAHRERGGSGVGAIGMCLTGGFALGMLLNPAVVAPALSQPSLPFPLSSRHRKHVGVNESTLAAIVHRCELDDIKVMGMRFTHDRLVPTERFASLRSALGDRFIAIEIDSSLGNSHGVPALAHSVLTHHFVDQQGHPTLQALEKLFEFFARSLGRQQVT